MSYKILTLSDRKEWAKLLEKLPIDQQDIYYTPEYYELYEKNGDGQGMCFVFEKDNYIALNPFLINSVNDLGYELDDAYFDIQGAYGYNGVVSSNYTLSFRNDFYEAFYQYCHKNNIIAEFVRYNPIIKNHLFAKDIHKLILNRKTVSLDLSTSYNEIFINEYSPKNRNMIRKGEKTLSVRNGNSLEEYEIFNPMYHHTMQQINAEKYYYFNNKFFNNIYHILTDYCFVLIAYDNVSNNPLGGLLLLIHNNKAHYFLSARGRKCDNNSVNNYLLDVAITTSKKKGCSTFHFGGGNTLDEKDSLLKFKMNFSKTINNFYISKKIISLTPYNTVCHLWEKQYPQRVEKFNNHLLKYRMIS
jgi:hypothetical protein